MTPTRRCCCDPRRSSERRRLALDSDHREELLPLQRGDDPFITKMLVGNNDIDKKKKLAPTCNNS
jgi:hypothetical protein